jgi:hypothetical protein
MADPVRIQFGHCIVEFAITGCRLLEPTEVAEVPFRRLMIAGLSGAPGFLWPAITVLGFNAAKRSSAAIQFARLSAVVSPTSALVVDDVAADDEVNRRHMQRGVVDGVSAALFNDAQFVTD